MGKRPVVSGQHHFKDLSMAIIFISETNNSIDNYDEVIVLLEARSRAHPAGRLSHVAAYTDDRYMVVDVWESQELLGTYRQRGR